MTESIEATVKFDAFVAEYEFLERAMNELRELLLRRRAPRAAIDALAVVGEHVTTHLSHEEQADGFFDNVTDQAPHLKAQAAELIREHSTLADALSDLQRYASGNAPSEPWWSELNTRYEAFREMFFRHEHAEIQMVEEALNECLETDD